MRKHINITEYLTERNALTQQIFIVGLLCAGQDIGDTALYESLRSLGVCTLLETENIQIIKYYV